MAALERRAIAAFESMGILMTDTCINYQSVLPPVRGEHLAYGDTGSTIYANSVFGARSNFEGGPAALCAALTGRVPRYGCHLDEHRRGTHLFEVRHRPRTWSDWGALGAVVGKRTGDYWSVPVLAGIEGSPTSDELKHFGAALASYGSVPLFHMPGVTPEAPDLASVFDGPPPVPAALGEADVEAFYTSFGRHEDKVDVVVVRGPPALAHRASGGRPRPRRQAGASANRAARRDFSGDQGRRGPHGDHQDRRGRRRHPPARCVLLSNVRARARPGERLDEPAQQLREAREHHLGLRLPPGARDHRGVHRGGGAREDVTVARTVLRAKPSAPGRRVRRQGRKT